MSEKKLIVGNWKMNGTFEETNNFLEVFLKQDLNNKVVVCPPFTLLQTFKEKLKGSNVMLGAQDCYFEEKGAFTGDISALMLKEVGCEYVILGHSERRHKHYETNYLVNKKMSAAQKANLTSIICVGETKAEKEEGKAKEVLSKQVKFSLFKEFNYESTVIAYEPVWSIGTGSIPTLEDITESIKEIRETILSISNKDVADKIKILYGGSVNAGNAKEVLSLEGVDGVLVGGASLKAEEFLLIANSNK